MTKKLMFIGLVVLLLVVIVGAGLQLVPDARAQDNDMDSEEAFGMMEGMMGPMMAKMMEGMMEAMLDVTAKPETAERMATFSKNYYDALLARGFTKEQAMNIVVATGLPSLPSLN